MIINVQYQPTSDKVRVKQYSYLKKLIIQKFEHDRQRAINFSITDPATCKHKMVYEKNMDEMHCNNCDQYLYRNYGDEEV